MSPKSTPFEVFEEIHKVVIDRISDNMWTHEFNLVSIFPLKQMTQQQMSLMLLCSSQSQTR